MKKLRTLLTLLVVSMCAVQSAWARTAPTLPSIQTLESGKTYCLYNVESDRFLSFDTNNGNGYPWARTDQEKAVKISLVNGTQYNIMFVEANRYWYSYAEDLYSLNSSSINSDYYRFTITEVESGYTIQRVYNSNQEHYIGFDGRNGNRIYANLTEGNIIWQLMDVTETERFVAKRNLYRALESADGYNVDKFEAVYENENSSNYALQEAADILNKAVDASNTIKKPNWSDYNILFDMDVVEPWYYYSDYNYFECRSIKNGTRTLNATVVVDDDATLVFTYYHHNGGVGSVYVDDELQLSINWDEGQREQRYFLKLSPGKHNVIWKYVNTDANNSKYCKIRDIGVEHTPTIEVSLLEPGSLGIEVLKNTDHIQNVRRLVISGEMNSDDWERIMMMTSLFSLDLTNAEITEIPKEQLSYYSHRDNLAFFHEVKLPKTLKVIGENAFHSTLIDEITFPEGLQTIGNYAFDDSRIKEAFIPETVTMIGESAFRNNESLMYVSYPASAKTIPQYCFNQCYQLQPFEIPEGITSIGSRAFYSCYKYNTNIPTTVTSIGSYAFNNCNLEHVVIRENVSVSNEAFEYCKLKTIEFPTSMWSAPSRVVKYCTSMTDINLKSPTMVKPNNILEGCDKSILTVHVPDYLVNTYKQDSYWYNYNIVGFSTADVDFWAINCDLTFRSGERFEGTPEVSLYNGAWLINGSDAMTISDFYNRLNIHNLSGENGMILSNCENIQIGAYEYGYYTQAKKWYFLCLPFDAKVGDIANNANASYAIRYYDGANRAENGTGGNWKNYSKDDIIPAGTGFIFQTSKECRSYFYAQDNASKQFAFSNKEFVKALAANESESIANKGWNLVGNPWQCYYNIHKLNFTAPITCWNVNNRNYTAYSIIDDDYAILPGEAFFVQCPDEVNSISFPIDGRQLTSVIESQNGAPAFGETKESARKLIDIELTDGELSDKTRFVLNPNAKMDYEPECDASKFFSMDDAVPQIYTIQNNEMLAINERPADNGIVQVGIKVAVDGTYTISAPRNQFQSIILFDRVTSIQTDLAQNSYTFSASAGSNDNRFELCLVGITITGIDELNETSETTNRYYNLNGQRVNLPRKGLYIANGKKVVIK